MSSSSETAVNSPVATSSALKKGNPAFLTALNRHQTAIDKLEADVESVEIKVQRLTDENREMRSELDLVKKMIKTQGKVQGTSEERLAVLEDGLAAMKEDGQINGQGNSDDESDKETGGDLTKWEEDKIAASLAAYSDTSLKELTRLAFSYKMDVAKLTPLHLPWYPESPDKATWPRITGTEESVLRFRWEKPWDNEDNYYALRMVVSYMKTHGPNIVPAAVGALVKISDDDLQRPVVDKFASLQKRLRDAGLLNGRTGERVVAAAVVSETAEDNTSDAAAVQIKMEVKKNTMTGVLNSRANGKLAVRLRKRENLPADSKYSDKKYDAAFVAKQMSDDEDELNEAGKRRVDMSLTRRPIGALRAVCGSGRGFGSNGSARYIPRVSGAVRDEPPKAAKKWENKTRRWMVDPGWLAKEENDKYDVESRIVESGKAWGDEEDPEVLARERQKLKSAKKVIAETKKRKTMEDALKNGVSKKAKLPKGVKGKGKAKASAAQLEGDEENSE